MYKMDFSQRFKMLRLEKNLNQTEFVENFKHVTGVNMTVSAVSNYERNQRVPEVPLLQIMSDYFDVTVDFLLGRTENRKETTPVQDGFREDNVKYRQCSDIYDALSRKLIDVGINRPGQELTTQQLKLFLKLGEDMAIRILKSKGIDPDELLK